MALVGYVPCTCLEQGRLPEPPRPFSLADLRRGEDGLVASRWLEGERASLDPDRFAERCGEAEERLRAWAASACEHEGGRQHSAELDNWMGVRDLRVVLAAAGGAARFPGLCAAVESFRSPMLPADQAKRALAEVEGFMERARTLRFDALVCADPEAILWWCAPGISDRIMVDQSLELGMSGESAYFKIGERVVETCRFRQEPVGAPGRFGMQPMEVTIDETGERVRFCDSLGPMDAPKTSREFWVEKRTAPFMYQGRYGIVERLAGLLRASAETGNPIYWVR